MPASVGRHVLGLLLGAALTLAPVSTVPLASAADIGGFTVCADDYALCSASICHAIAGDPRHVACPCEGPFHGLNIGHSTCSARSGALMSTFSLHNLTASAVQKPLRMLACRGDRAGPWAACLDAPCTTRDGAVSCKCPVHPKSDFLILSPTCPSDEGGLNAICSKMASAVASIDANASQKIISSFYGKPPEILYCAAPRPH